MSKGDGKVIFDTINVLLEEIQTLDLVWENSPEDIEQMSHALGVLDHYHRWLLRYCDLLKRGVTMRKDEIKDIHANIRAILDELQGLDEAWDWSDDELEKVAGDISDLDHYMTKLRNYYQMFRGIE